MGNLEEIEAIKRLKSKYFRNLDTKSWDELEQCFTKDATTSYYSGMFSHQGVDDIMKFLSEVVGPPTTMHHGHNPEIDIISDNTATGIWRLEDYVIVHDFNMSMHGSAIYHDEYVKVNGEWKIKHTGFDRVFEETWDRADAPSLKLTHDMWGHITEST